MAQSVNSDLDKADDYDFRRQSEDQLFKLLLRTNTLEDMTNSQNELSSNDLDQICYRLPSITSGQSIRSKKLVSEKKTANRIVGTPDYRAPEIIMLQGCD